jgi:hypothetical protein
VVNITKILKKESKITKFIQYNHKKTTFVVLVLISLLLFITPQMIDGASHLKYLQNLGWVLGVPHDWVQIDGKTAYYQSPSGGEVIALYDTARVPNCTTIDTCVKSAYNLNINRGLSANSLQISDHTLGGFPSKILMGPNFYYIFTAANGLIYTLIFKGTTPVTFEYNVFDIKEQIRMQNNLYELMRDAIRCTWPYYCVPSYR